MTVPPGADIRGYCTALGIPVPGWARVNASVRCFADPAAHQHEDRKPSCSVNLEHGAWNCRGCGAHGGAYDAAIAKGHTPRSAIDLMIEHRLAERRAHRPSRRTAATTRRADRQPTAMTPPTRSRRLIVTEADVALWQQRLASCRQPLPQLRAEQRALWRPETMRELGLGWDRGRFTIPIRDHSGQLQGILRYAPTLARAPKMLAITGTRLGLIPHPSAEPSPWIILVEGPPDMIAAQSRGLPAIAVPGDHAWEPEWAPQLAGRYVAIIADADSAGRGAALRIAHDLSAHAATVRTVELAPGRDDGYDLTDWLHAHPDAVGANAMRQISQAAAIQPAESPDSRHTPIAAIGSPQLPATHRLATTPPAGPSNTLSPSHVAHRRRPFIR